MLQGAAVDVPTAKSTEEMDFDKRSSRYMLLHDEVCVGVAQAELTIPNELAFFGAEIVAELQALSQFRFFRSAFLLGKDIEQGRVIQLTSGTTVLAALRGTGLTRCIIACIASKGMPCSLSVCK